MGYLDTKWGGTGTEDGQFDNPVGIACDTTGNVYVLERGNYRVQMFDQNGTFITKWGSKGEGNGQFSYPSDIAIDKEGNIFISDESQYRIQRFK